MINKNKDKSSLAFIYSYVKLKYPNEKKYINSLASLF
jgi:hypothetical protein